MQLIKAELIECREGGHSERGSPEKSFSAGNPKFELFFFIFLLIENRFRRSVTKALILTSKTI